MWALNNKSLRLLKMKLMPRASQSASTEIRASAMEFPLGGQSTMSLRESPHAGASPRSFDWVGKDMD